MSARSQFGAMVLIAVVAAAVRLPWAMLQPTDPDVLRQQLPDQYEYLMLGRNLWQDGRLAFTDPRFGQDVYAFRMPGYPLLIAATAGSPTAVRAIQILLDISTVIGIYLLARRLLTSRDADHPGPWPLIAAAAVALNPWLVYFSALLLSEMLFTALLTWGMFLLTAGDKSRRWATAAGMAILAMSVHVRPSALLLAPLVAMAAVWMNSRSGQPYQSMPRRRTGRAIAAGLVACGAVALVLLPWAIRNASHPRLNAWIWTTTNAGITSYDGLRPGATGASDQSFITDMPELQTMTELERSQYLSTLAKESAAADPMRVARLAAVKIARTWSPVPLSDQFSRLRYVLPGLLFTVPFFALALAGLAGSSLSRPAKLYLLLPAIYLTAIHALSVGSARYRIPAEAPMAVLAAAGAATIAGCARRA